MGRSSRQAASDISWDKMAEKAEPGLEIRTRRRDRKRKAETKTSNVVGDEGKEEREGRREKMRSVFINPVSTNYPCIYSVLLGIRIVLQNNSANESLFYSACIMK